MDAVRGLKGQFDKFTSAARPNSLVQAPLSGLLRGFYRSLFQKNTTFFTFILVGAIGFEMLTGSIVDNVWNDLNKGVRMHITTFNELILLQIIRKALKILGELSSQR